MHNFATLFAPEAAHAKLTELPEMIQCCIAFGEAHKDATADFAAYQLVVTDYFEDFAYSVDISSRTGRVVFVHVTYEPNDLGIKCESGGRLSEDEFVARFVNLYPELSRAMVRPTLSDSEVLKISQEGGE